MPPIVRLYRNSIVYAAILIAVFGVVGYTFRSTIQDAFDVRALFQLAQLPEEETLDQIQVSSDEQRDERGEADTNSSNTNQTEVLGVETKKKPLPAEINIKVPFTTFTQGVFSLSMSISCVERLENSISPNSDSDARMTEFEISFPCTNAVTSRASAFCALRALGFVLNSLLIVSISSRDKNVNNFKYSITLSSDTLSQNW